MKKIIVFLFLLSQIEVSSQSVSSAQAVIDAENSFAGLSKSTNTVNAFMSYLSDNTVMFVDHKPVIGKKSWADKKPDSTLLFWWPVFVGVSADGAMGFSTGPWEWSKNRESQPQGYGYYATIWKKDEESKWKMGVDLGITFPESEKVNQALTTSPTGNSVTGTHSVTEQRLFIFDKTYNSNLNESSVSFLSSYFTTDGHLLRNGHKPCAQPSEFKTIDEKGQKFSFETDGVGIAGSNDLGYAYGTVTIEFVKDGKPVTEQRNYLRAWKRENNNWKIVLDVISR